MKVGRKTEKGNLKVVLSGNSPGLYIFVAPTSPWFGSWQVYQSPSLIFCNFFVILFIFIYFNCMNILPVTVYGHHVCSWCLQESQIPWSWSYKLL